MKSRLFWAIILLLWTTKICCQEAIGDNRLAGHVYLSSSTSAFEKKSGISPLALQLKFGYKINPKLSTYLTAEGMFGFRYKEYGYGDYLGSNAIGGGADYSLSHLSKAILPSSCELLLHVSCGTTLGHVQWKYTYYEIGATMGFKANNSPLFGIGYRIMDSRNHFVKDINGFYFTLGFKL